MEIRGKIIAYATDKEEKRSWNRKRPNEEVTGIGTLWCRKFIIRDRKVANWVGTFGNLLFVYQLHSISGRFLKFEEFQLKFLSVVLTNVLFHESLRRY